MFYSMICKQHGREERCWFCQERHFVMSVSEKQIIHKAEMFRSMM